MKCVWQQAADLLTYRTNLLQHLIRKFFLQTCTSKKRSLSIGTTLKLLNPMGKITGHAEVCHAPREKDRFPHNVYFKQFTSANNVIHHSALFVCGGVPQKRILRFKSETW
jgi:hypothetical protein